MQLKINLLLLNRIIDEYIIEQNYIFFTSMVAILNISN